VDRARDPGEGDPSAPLQIRSRGGKFVIRGNIFGADANEPDSFGLQCSARRRGPGQSLPMAMARHHEDGGFSGWRTPSSLHPWRASSTWPRSPRASPSTTTSKCCCRRLGRSFINSFTVTIPATIIPILMAAFAAYALAWMRFPFRGVIVAVVVGLLVVPLQMSLIPLLSLYNGIANAFGAEDGKTYLSIWLAPPRSDLPLAIYLLRNYMAGLPKGDHGNPGASTAPATSRSSPVWCAPELPGARFLLDLPVPLGLERPVGRHGVPGRPGEQAGADRQAGLAAASRGNNWEILTAGAFITIVVPLIVFFSLQRYFVRGLLAGSVK
jgi:alpha-glucoside transport system permease protein